jgi:hypothetical protein
VRSATRIAASLATLITLTVVAAACSDNSDSHDGQPPTPTGVTSTQPSTLPTSASPAPNETVIEVSVMDGRVSPSPDRRVEVSRGQLVRIVVNSDVADEIHVHGYDLEEAVDAGGAATLEFEADQPGAFEVELHDQDPGLLFTLLVR